MQTVSNEWKENQKATITSEGFVEVSLDIADPTAIADATSQDNGSTYISDTPQIVTTVDKNIAPYTTLEQNLWVLDGSRKHYSPTEQGDSGYIGDVMSDERGFFAPRPVITVNFSQIHTNIVPAVTIEWGEAYGEYAKDFKVTVYNDTYIVAEKEVTNNRNMKSVVMMDFMNYNKITVTITRWCLPNRRARIKEIFIGMNQVYTKKELVDYSHSQNVDPLSASLPKSEVSFTVDNSDNAYNPSNPNGLSKYLMERQEIKTRYGYKMNEGIEWIKGGTFYLSGWEAQQSGITATFIARDILEFMSEMYYEGEYAPNGISLYDLAERLFIKANLPLNEDGSKKWFINSFLKQVYTTAPLPVDTIANNLQLIANAARSVIYQDRNGTIHIEPLLPKNLYLNVFVGNNCSKANDSITTLTANSDTYFYILGKVFPGKKYTLSFEADVPSGSEWAFELTRSVEKHKIKIENGKNVASFTQAEGYPARITMDDTTRTPALPIKMYNFMIIEGEYDNDTIPLYNKYTGNDNLFDINAYDSNYENISSVSVNGDIVSVVSENRGEASFPTIFYDIPVKDNVKYGLTGRVFGKNGAYPSIRAVAYRDDTIIKNLYLVYNQYQQFTTLEIPATTNRLRLSFLNEETSRTGTCIFEGIYLFEIPSDTVQHTNTDYNVDLFNSYAKSDTSLSKPIKDVKTVAYQYYQGESVELYKGSMSIIGTQDVLISYSSQGINHTTTVTNGTLNSAKYYTNACILNITANGNVDILVSGNALKESKTEVTYPCNISGETLTVDNPLITNPETAMLMGEWMNSYLQSRVTLTSSWRADPRIDALDVIRNKDDFSNNLVRMTNVSLTYNGAFRGSGEGRVM